MGKVTDKDKGWNRLQELAKSLAADDVHVRVGVLDDGRAGSEDHGGITTGQLAVAMELGTATIPARSWVGLTFDRARTEVQADMRTLLGHIVDGKITVDKALNVLGAKYSAAVKNTVTQGEQIQPPNAPSTLARKQGKTHNNRDSKGRFKKGYGAALKYGVRTLIDTGRMVGAVTWATFGSGK
jgi:hypothetical protein